MPATDSFYARLLKYHPNHRVLVVLSGPHAGAKIVVPADKGSFLSKTEVGEDGTYHVDARWWAKKRSSLSSAKAKATGNPRKRVARSGKTPQWASSPIENPSLLGWLRGALWSRPEQSAPLKQTKAIFDTPQGQLVQSSGESVRKLPVVDSKFELPWSFIMEGPGRDPTGYAQEIFEVMRWDSAKRSLAPAHRYSGNYFLYEGRDTFSSLSEPRLHRKVPVGPNAPFICACDVLDVMRDGIPRSIGSIFVKLYDRPVYAFEDEGLVDVARSAIEFLIDSGALCVSNPISEFFGSEDIEEFEEADDISLLWADQSILPYGRCWSHDEARSYEDARNATMLCTYVGSRERGPVEQAILCLKGLKDSVCGGPTTTVQEDGYAAEHLVDGLAHAYGLMKRRRRGGYEEVSEKESEQICHIVTEMTRALAREFADGLADQVGDRCQLMRTSFGAQAGAVAAKVVNKMRGR